MNWKVPKGWKESSIQKELKKVAGEFETNCKQGNISPEKRTFQEYSKYVMKLKERDNKHKTVLRYYQLLERINNEIGFFKLSTLNGEHLNQFYMKLAENGQNKKTGGYLSKKTILEYNRLIHCILAQAVKEGLIKTNIANMATPPKNPKKEATIFELDEVKQIINALSTEPIKYQALLRLLIDTGARRGEILGLKWACIDFDNNTIKIEQTILYSPERGVYSSSTKTEDIRTISISPEITFLLKKYKNEKNEEKLKLGSYWQDTGYVFTNEKGLPINPDSIYKWINRFSARHNLPHINPHKFRHTQASILYQRGLDPITIAKRLGHAQVSTTQNIYAHLMANSDKNASNTIAEALYRN